MRKKETTYKTRNNHTICYMFLENNKKSKILVSAKNVHWWESPWTFDRSRVLSPVKPPTMTWISNCMDVLVLVMVMEIIIVIPVSVKKTFLFTRALALQHSSRRFSPALDLVFFGLIVPRVFFSGWVFFRRHRLIISIRTISSWGYQIPEPLLVFASQCPLKVQISQGLGPFFQIYLLKTD